nr:MAG: RNA-dependent RNA polymerase [Coquillettidia bunyavirus]
MESFTAYSMASFRSLLPDNLEEPIDMASIEGLCYSTLVQLGDVVCDYQDSHTPYVHHHVRYFDFPVDCFIIEKVVTTGLWSWSINIPLGIIEDDPTFEMLLSGHRDTDGMRSLRHDIVGMSLSDSPTDVRLRTIFPFLNGQVAGSLSPDYHVCLNGCNYFIELGTTKADDPASGERDMQRKLQKYGSILSDIEHDKPCILVVIIVGKKFVVSNFMLHKALVDKLIVYMSLATSLERRIVGLNLPELMTPLESQSETLQMMITKQFSGLPVVTAKEENLCITQQLIDRIGQPANQKKVASYFLREIRNSGKQAQETIRAGYTPDTDPRLITFQNTLRTQESKSTVKAILAMPLVFVQRSAYFDSTVIPFLIGGEHGQMTPVLEVWQSAMRGYVNVHTDYVSKASMTESELYYTDPVDQHFVEKRLKEERNKAHRCNLHGKLSEDTLRILALDGVWGKRWKNDPEKLEKEKLKSIPYHIDTDVSDIESFITDHTLFDEVYTEINDQAMQLLLTSLVSLGQQADCVGDVESLMRTQIYSALDLISTIALELSISLKQHVDKKQVLIKKLAYYEVYLLIIPTKGSEHIFFSIYIPGQQDIRILCDLPFRTMHKAIDGGYYTDFCSFRADKLANYATISSSFIGICSYFAYHYSLRDVTSWKIQKCSDAYQMVLMTLLIRLENKLNTEEAITVSRYMYMEVLKSASGIKPDPFKLICKFSTCIRSRLQLFVVNRLILAFSMMQRNPIYRVEPSESSEFNQDEDVISNDYWEGLINPYTLTYERKAGRVVSLFYLGYAVDKDQVAQENSDFKIIQKAIKKDLEFELGDPTRSTGMWDDFEDTPMEKQFSINTILWGCELMESEMIKRYGMGYAEVLERKILERLARHMTHDLATMKASARIDHVPWDKLDSADRLLETRTSRLKVIEALMKELQLFEHNPFINLSTIVHVVESTSRGVISDLFKKNQHGGLREIYVLTIKSRILALFVETCARCLCEEFDCEAMTHPDMKLEVVERHKLITAKICYSSKREATEFQCSADKKNWNNNLVMPALAIPLIKLLPKRMHGAIQRTLNMWNERLIQLPRGVLKLLINRTPLSDPTYIRMAQEFECPGGISNVPLFPSPKSGYCILRRGMMQGILHYTSSLLHVSYLTITKSLIKTYLKSKSPNSICLVDQMCSSDDSATIISIIHDNSSTMAERARIMLEAEIVCQALTTFCAYSCFTNSEKSVMGSANQLEFNSEFIIGNTLAVPVIKWVFACYGVSESENLLLRLQTLYNLMSQVSAAGLPAVNTSILQLSQGLLHYKLMGSDTNMWFPLYSTEILTWPDPSLGFFLMDNIYCPGLLGFSYHHWLHCRVNQMFCIKKKSVLNGTLGFNPEGGLIDTFLVRHGDSARYESLLSTISGGLTALEIREIINKTPLLLYSEAHSTQDAEFKILAKSLLPGTAQSLARGVPFIQAVATSAYGLQSYCFTRSEASYSSGKTEKSYSKVSLIGEIKIRREKTGAAENLGKMTAEALCFPNYIRYQNYQITLEKYKEAIIVPVASMRHKKSIMRFPQETSAISISLYDLVKEKWAGINYTHSVQLKNQCWNDYRILMPWLSDTLEETLEKSPFLDHVELHNFVSSRCKHSRTVARVGPAIRASFPLGQIDQIARRTHQDGFILGSRAEKTTSGFQRFRDRRTSMGLALEIPNEAFRESMVKKAAKTCKLLKGELENIKERPRREAMLAVMVACINGEDSSVIQKAIEDMGNGLLIAWSVAQQKIYGQGPKLQSKWIGKGELVLCNKDLICEISIQDSVATRIKTNDLRGVRRLQMQIVKILKEQGVYPGKATPSGNYRIFLTPGGVDPYGPGTPILELSSRFLPSVKSLGSLKFDYYIEHGCLSLRQITTNLLPAVVLSYRPAAQEFESCHSSEVMDSVWDAWYYQAKLDAFVADGLITKTVDRYNDEHSAIKNTKEAKETTALMQFMRDTLLSRLRHRGYAASIEVAKLPSYTQDTMEEEAIGQVLKDVYDENKIVDRCVIDDDELPLLMQVVEKRSLITVGVDGELVKELAGDDMDFADYYMRNLISGRPVELVSAQLTTRYGVMPFWDDYINAIGRVNPYAWPELLSGRTVAGIKNSDNIIALLLKRPSRPGRYFGSTVSEQVEEEVMMAVYASSDSSKTRSSRWNTKTSLYRNEFASAFTRITAKLLKEAEEGMTRDQMVAQLEDITQQALTKAQEEVDPLFDSPEGTPIKDLSKPSISLPEQIGSWMKLTEEFGPGENYIEPPIDSLLSSDELNWLYAMLKDKLGISSDFFESAVCLTYYLRGSMEIPKDRVYDLTMKNVYFCLIGGGGSKNETGHWVSVVTGVRNDNSVELYDSMANTNNLIPVYEQISTIFPMLTTDDIIFMPIQKQTTPSCGHACFMRACHRLLGWDKPLCYTDESLRKWVTACLKSRTLFPMKATC